MMIVLRFQRTVDQSSLIRSVQAVSILVCERLEFGLSVSTTFPWVLFLQTTNITLEMLNSYRNVNKTKRKLLLFSIPLWLELIFSTDNAVLLTFEKYVYQYPLNLEHERKPPLSECESINLSIKFHKVR